MILGTLCVVFSFGKGRDYLLRPAGMFFAFAGQICATPVSAAETELSPLCVRGRIFSSFNRWLSWFFTCREARCRHGKRWAKAHVYCCNLWSSDAIVCVLHRSLHHHFCGGDAPVGQAHDRQRRDHLDRIPLLLVLHLRLRRLHPAHPEWRGPAPHLHAPHAAQPLGDLHGRWARYLGLRPPWPCFFETFNW